MAKDAIRCYIEALLKDKMLQKSTEAKREKVGVRVQFFILCPNFPGFILGISKNRGTAAGF